MKPIFVESNEIVSILDSLAIVMTLSNDPSLFDMGWTNLKEQTQIDLSRYRYNSFIEAKTDVVDDLKERISSLILQQYRRNYGDMYREASYIFEGDRYHHAEGKSYKQRFSIKISDQNKVDIVGAEFGLKNTYIEFFEEELPILLN